MAPWKASLPHRSDFPPRALVFDIPPLGSHAFSENPRFFKSLSASEELNENLLFVPSGGSFPDSKF